jgi:hypothetical protein
MSLHITAAKITSDYVATVATMVPDAVIADTDGDAAWTLTDLPDQLSSLAERYFDRSRAITAMQLAESYGPGVPPVGGEWALMNSWRAELDLPPDPRSDLPSGGSGEASVLTGEGLAEQADDEVPPVPRTYLLAIPSLAGQDGKVSVRMVGLTGQVTLRLPAIVEDHSDYYAELDDEWPNVRLDISRDVAWGLWGVLSDALMPEVDAVPDWAAVSVGPLDDDGQALPDPDLDHSF